MTEKLKDQDETTVAHRSVISLRIGYIVSLAAIAIICTFFYIEQNTRNQSIQQIGKLAEKFAELDHAMGAIADRSNRLAQTYAENQADIDPKLANATLLKKREIRENMPVDPDLISAVSSLRFRFERARWKLKHLKDEWVRSPAELIKGIQARSRYMTNTDPFLHHEQMLGAKRVDAVRTKKDIYWAGREIHALYEEVIQPSNLFVHEQFRNYLANLSLVQGALLQRYLLATMGILLVLGLGVFLPIDIIIRQMIKRLQNKTREIDAALTKAQMGDRAKSEFLATMSHELRTPLTSIKACIGLMGGLMSDELSDDGKSMLEIANKNCETLLLLITDLLDFEKIISGTMSMDIKQHDLAVLVHSAIETNQVYAQSHSVRFNLNEPQTPKWAEVDEYRFAQIMRNLLSNAAKFSVADSVVDISVLDGDGEIIVTVSDQGIGISDEHKECIFERFIQIDSSDNRQRSGSGLGLSITKAFVEGMEGVISFESELGKGTTFYISFPATGNSPVS